MIFPDLLAEVERLDIGGWIMMVGCVGLYCGLLVFCMTRVLKSPPVGENGETAKRQKDES